MNRHRIIAAVSAAFGEIVESAATDVVPNAVVQFERPDTSGIEPKVYMFMYQVTPNAAARNLELPSRYADGAAKQRPILALDLHYLLTFVGDDKKLEPQKMLGSVTSTLHAFPMLTPDAIRSAQVDLTEGPLVGDDEDIPVANVRFTPLPLNLEELSKVWSIFFQTPYSLSVGYKASMALVEYDLALRPPLPAQSPAGKSGMLDNPVLAQVYSEAGHYWPIDDTSKIILTGKRLRGEQTLVRFVSGSIDAIPSDVTNNRITTTIPTAAHKVAVHPVRVVHRPWDAEPDDSSNEVLSNLTSFVLHPRIVSMQLGTELQLTVSPVIEQEQVGSVLLDELDTDTPTSHRIKEKDGSRNQASDTLIFELNGVSAGTYAVRVSVDGIDSLIEIDQTTQTVAHPLVVP